MADWSIDPGFHDEPTHVPTGDECEAWLRSDLCSHSDCRECGAAVAKQLRAEARAGFIGRVAPALHRLHGHLRQREAQAMADAQEHV